MDIQPLNPLDQLHPRHRHLHHRRLHHLTVHLPLRPPHLPPLRRLPFRRQRLLPLLPRRRRHHVLPCPLRPPGRRQGRQSPGEFDVRLRGRHLGVVFSRG